MVSEYTGLSFKEIGELNIVDYWMFLRDSYIYWKSQTEDGREELREFKRLTETEPDVKRLRELFGNNKAR